MIYLTYPLCGAKTFTEDNKDSIYISKKLFQNQETDKATFRDYIEYAIFISKEYKNVFIDVDADIAEYCNKLENSDKIFTVIIPHVSLYEEWKQRASDEAERTKDLYDVKMYGHIVDFFASELYMINSETFYLPKITIYDKDAKLRDLI